MTRDLRGRYLEVCDAAISSCDVCVCACGWSLRGADGAASLSCGRREEGFDWWDGVGAAFGGGYRGYRRGGGCGSFGAGCGGADGKFWSGAVSAAGLWGVRWRGRMLLGGSGCPNATGGGCPGWVAGGAKDGGEAGAGAGYR